MNEVHALFHHQIGTVTLIGWQGRLSFHRVRHYMQASIDKQTGHDLEPNAPHAAFPALYDDIVLPVTDPIINRVSAAWSDGFATLPPGAVLQSRGMTDEDTK